MIKVLVPIANGTEEMEAIIIVDMLRRAGINVTLASSDNIVTCSKGVKIIPDVIINSISDEIEFDAIILPGGIQGTDNLSENSDLIQILKRHNSKNKILGAICAAPTILSNHKIIGNDSIITSHPSVKNLLSNYNYSENNTEVYKNIITSRGAGTAFDFALEIISKLIGSEKAEEIKKSIVLNN